MSEDKGLQIPYDEDAEKAVLGVCLTDPETLDVVVQILEARDFFLDRHAQIFETMLELKDQGRRIDTVEMGNALRSKGILDAVGGIPYLLDLMSGMIYSSNIKSYAQIVKDKSTLRKLIRATDEISLKAYEDKEETSSIVEDAEKKIFDISQSDKREGLRPVSELIKEAKDRIDQLAENSGQLSGIDTGFADINKKFDGFQRSDLILLAARPGMGKTALGLNFCLNAAKAGHSVAVFSLEMSAVQLVMRLISSVTSIPSSDLRIGKVDNPTELGLGMAHLSKLNIYIDDTASISLSELRAKCRRLKAERGLDFLMIDYLQLMTIGGKQESRQQEISSISRGLKALAKELDIPVLAISQLNRAAEKREGQRPQISDLRESGAIEQDADIIMLLYREDYYDPDTERPNTADLNVAKYRNGPTGNIELVFRPEAMSFYNAIHEDY